ncbi:hypothetical protein DEMA109039_16665 [Deinococcus marmoris]
MNFLDAEHGGNRRFQQPDLLQRVAHGNAGGTLGKRMVHGLAHKRDGAAGARVGLQDVRHVVLDRPLHVHQAAHAQRQRQPLGVGLHAGQQLGAQADRGQHAGAVAAVNPGGLHMLHDPGHHGAFAVAQCIHVQLQRPFQKLIQQDAGLALHGGVHLVQIGGQLGHAANGAHGAAPQHVAGPGHQREAQLFCQCLSLVRRRSHQPTRLRQAQTFAQRVEAGAVLGLVDGVRAGADNRCTRRLQPPRQLQRRLPAQLHDHAHGFLVIHDVHHVFKGQRLKVQPVCRVVIGADRLRVGVDHDRLVPGVLQGPDRVYGGVIKLHALPNPVGAAAQDDHLGPIGGRDLVLPLVGGVVVRRVRLELGGAGVHRLVHRGGLRLFA